MSVATHTLLAADLRAFAEDIATEFNAGNIRAPIHLDGGNEDQLIEVFQTIGRADWVCGSWRMMSKCLLHGVPPTELKAAILAGRSISLCFPEHRIISSAIVGGILPIALGIAWQIKRSGGANRVHCFMGDMTVRSGIASECIRYADGHRLPIRWITEDNGKSVCTDTRQVWGDEQRYTDVERYRYTPIFPHAGAGVRVEF